MIQTALITAPSRADDLIFGRTVLERLMILCERAGIRRFVIEAPREAHAHAQSALGSYRDRPEVALADSIASGSAGLDPDAICISFSGNLVFAQSNLREALARYEAQPTATIRLCSADLESGGAITIASLSDLLSRAASDDATVIKAANALPFALNGRPEGREEAERRLARSVRNESLATDALMARVLDRKISWRISLRLARLRISPNVITLANTALGFGCALMLASVSYPLRLAGALLFLASITIDGVDGEVARLRLVESKLGGWLDVLTDNLVHIAIFAGLIAGCYRAAHSSAYLYLLPILLLGFGFCAVSVNRALGVAGQRTEQWLSRVERATGRDFAYIIVVLAIIDRLCWFAWTATAGTYVFALVLWIFTNRLLRRARQRA